MAEIPAALRPPGVDFLARSISDLGLPHPLCVDAARQAIAAGDASSVRRIAQEMSSSFLRPVINATGVLLHTNLGRAPLRLGYPENDSGRADSAASAAVKRSRSSNPRSGLSRRNSGSENAPVRYNNLEYDLARGERGSRHSHAAALLAKLCDAEAALVVNNCAAAVTLAVAALAGGRSAVVSRSELVEIGGGFRIPAVIAAAGAHLVEVGTTNRTRLNDYNEAITNAGAAAALVLKVHQSNYRIVGFAEAASVPELATLPVPLVVDIGSGLLDEACPWLRDGPPLWLKGEPAARQCLAAGANLVTFSGDKLLGGPQAGIIAGSSKLISRCARHPLARAFRAGSLILAELQSLALTYLERRGANIPFWKMATASQENLLKRAEALGVGTPELMNSTTGGGTLPGVEIPSAGISLKGDLTQKLRSAGEGQAPVVARVFSQRTYLDLRTVDPLDDETLADAAAVAAA